MSKKILKQLAEGLFAITLHDELWGNPKGEFFTTENAGKLNLKLGQTLQHFKREVKLETGEGAGKGNNPKSADELIKGAKTIETVDLVNIAKDVEAKGENRVTVITAYDERITELEAKA